MRRSRLPFWGQKGLFSGGELLALGRVRGVTLQSYSSFFVQRSEEQEDITLSLLLLLWGTWTTCLLHWRKSISWLVNMWKWDEVTQERYRIFSYSGCARHSHLFKGGTFGKKPVICLKGGKNLNVRLPGLVSTTSSNRSKELKNTTQTFQLETQTEILSRWWFQPIWKILVKLDHFPR